MAFLSEADLEQVQTPQLPRSRPIGRAKVKHNKVCLMQISDERSFRSTGCRAS